MPLEVGQGQNVGLRDFGHILTLLPTGVSEFHKHISFSILEITYQISDTNMVYMETKDNKGQWVMEST